MPTTHIIFDLLDIYAEEDPVFGGSWYTVMVAKVSKDGKVVRISLYGNQTLERFVLETLHKECRRFTAGLRADIRVQLLTSGPGAAVMQVNGSDKQFLSDMKSKILRHAYRAMIIKTVQKLLGTFEE